MTEEGDAWLWGGCEGGSCRAREDISVQKGDNQRGVLALEGEEGRQIKVCNRELRVIDPFVEYFPSGHCPIISCAGEPGGMVGLEITEHQLVHDPPEGSQNLGAGRCRWTLTLKKGNALSPKSAFNNQDFHRGLVGEYVTIKNPVGDGMEDESDNSTIAAPDGSIKSVNTLRKEFTLSFVSCTKVTNIWLR